MSKFIFTFLLLHIIIISVAGLDSFNFVLQWPKSVCKQTCNSTTLPRRVTIHGLWPENRDGLHPLKPSKEIFPSDSELQNRTNLYDNLQSFWPDVENGKDYEFWKAEWFKHGKYSEKYSYEYFLFATNRYKNLKVSTLFERLAKLQDHPITIGESYELPLLQKQLKAVFNDGKVDVVVRCKPETVFQEVFVYFNATSLKMLPPPAGMKSNCSVKEKILIPSP